MRCLRPECSVCKGGDTVSVGGVQADAVVADG